MNPANMIKEQQLDLFADRTSCHDFVTNQFRLLLSSPAYILMVRFRALLLTGTEFVETTCGNIRLYLVKIGPLCDGIPEKFMLLFQVIIPIRTSSA